jgi:hypothetical protein
LFKLPVAPVLVPAEPLEDEPAEPPLYCAKAMPEENSDSPKAAANAIMRDFISFSLSRYDAGGSWPWRTMNATALA